VCADVVFPTREKRLPHEVSINTVMPSFELKLSRR
jgi:hypothetical protein